MDKTSVIFGNPIDEKTVKKAEKSKAKFLKKFGDDTNKQYHLGLQPIDEIKEIRIQNLVLADKPAKKDGETEAPKPAYERRIELPFRVDADKANAAFKDGILKIELPKADPSAPRRIAIANA